MYKVEQRNLKLKQTDAIELAVKGAKEAKQN
jgi:hypothetical protein